MDAEVPEIIEDSSVDTEEATGGVEQDPEAEPERPEPPRRPALMRDPEFDAAPWVVFVLGLGAWALVFNDYVLS